MLTETGRVVGIETDGIWVETIRRSTCGTCSAQKGCGHGLLNRISEGKRGYVRALPGGHSVEDYKVDDQVLISIPEEVILVRVADWPLALYWFAGTAFIIDRTRSFNRFFCASILRS